MASSHFKHSQINQQMHLALALATIAIAAQAQTAPPVQILDAAGNPLPQCAFKPSSGLARLEPPLTNQMMVGISLDWSYETPLKSKEKTKNHTPAVYNAWLDLVPGTFNGTGFDASMLNWFGSEAGYVGAMLELTLNPPKDMRIADLKDLTPAMYDGISKACQTINQRYGVPIFLRWAHEMNGDWYGWGNEPRAFIESWQQLTNSVRKYTNMTAMVWAPNIGITYPFVGGSDGGARSTPRSNGTDFDLLDTNGDGKIDNFDDPYSPFWPGDEYVDWVGLSLYYYPRQNCHNNCPLPERYFEQLLTGGFNNPDTPGGGNTADWQRTRNFYQQFAASKNKPMMLPETGAPWIAEWATRAGATTEVAIKSAWYNQLLSTATLTTYPRLKLVVNFEERKPLALDGEPAIQDWRVTNNSVTLDWWNGKLTEFQGNLKFANELVYNCDGSVVIGTKGTASGATTTAGGSAVVTGAPSAASTSSKSGAVGLSGVVLSVLALLASFVL
ncbi:glycoside hydrolase superfamily, partial [Chytriomyces cf. hyalinus JEL632]